VRIEFLSYLTKRRSARICILLCTIFVLTALVEAVSRFTLTLPAVFIVDILDAAMILRLSYESTLMFIGYGILLFGMLSAVFPMFRDSKFRPNSKKLQIHFIILSSFTVTFLIARLFVAILNADINPVCQLWVKGYRIHHFFVGIGLLAIAGWLGHINGGSRSIITKVSAGIYGTGMGLVADEFGLLLTFGDYWAEQSYIFFVLISLLLLIALLEEAYKLFKTANKTAKNLNSMVITFIYGEWKP